MPDPPALGKPLPVHQRNAAGDPRRMRRIIAEDESWSLAVIQPLSELCLQHIVRNFQERPLVETLLPKHRAKVLSRLSTALPLPVTANLIAHEDYWQRCCTERWPTCDVSRYGSSWKRLFLERHLENLIELFIPDLSDPGAVCSTAELSKNYIRRLEIRQLLPPVRVERGREDEAEDVSDSGSDAGGDLPSMDHFDLGLIAGALCDLEELHLVFGVRGCGMNFQWNLFRFTDRDCTSLADTLKTLKKLKVFRLLRSKVDDDKDGGKQLLEGMSENRTMLEFDLRLTDVGQESEFYMNQVLRGNQERAQGQTQQ